MSGPLTSASAAFVAKNSRLPPYAIEQSLRFNNGDSAHLHRTPGSAGSQTTFTLSVWVKSSVPSSGSEYFYSTHNGSRWNGILRRSGNYDFGVDESGSGAPKVVTNAKLRDPSAWYHLVMAYDTTQATSTDRVKIWINGELQSINTGAGSYPNQNHGSTFNRTTKHWIGALDDTASVYYTKDFYLAEYHLLDGTAVTNAEDFGEYDQSGVWRPIEYTGGNYGTTGFYLKFDPTAANGIGHDHSGNGNNWTASGFNTTEGNGSYAIDCSTVSGGGSFANAFDGVLTSNAGSDNYSGEVWTWTPTGGYAYSSSVEVYGGEAAYDQARINSDSYVAMNGGWKTIKTGSGTITKLDVRDSRGNAAASIGAIRIDGTILIDNLFNSDSDVVKDTPTNNYCTWNAISNNGVTLANGNLDTSSGSTGNCRGTIAVTSGKYYWEYSRITTGTGTPFVMGLCEADGYSPTGHDNWTRGVYFYTDGSGNGQVRYYENGSNVTASSVTVPTNMRRFYARDVLQVAFDADSGKVWFGKNGDYLDSAGGTTGNPGAGTYATVTLQGTDIPITPMRDHAGVAISAKANFGQHDFVFDPPTGFKALNTSNLPAPDIADGSDYFQTVLYTGNNTTHAITVADNSGNAWGPDFVWIKPRSTADHHRLNDKVRGVNKTISSNLTNAEYGPVNAYLDSFDSGGFTISSSDAGWNSSSHTYVAWNWLEGASQGFDIVSYTGDDVNGRSVAHSLGVVPAFIIVKARNAVEAWAIWHQDLGGATKYLTFTTAAVATASAIFGGGANEQLPDSTNFYVGSNGMVNDTGVNYIAYCFAEVEGYSKFGSYSGGDGVFVYLGFKPSLLILKGTVGTRNWIILDSKRNTYNVVDDVIHPNLTNAESAQSSSSVDFVSNGFVTRGGNISGAGDLTVFAAFAEHPFGGSGVNPATAR